MMLRPYQVAAVEAAEREFLSRRRALIVAATGTGKTVILAALAERWRPRGRILVLAHREELLDQAAEKIGASTLLSTAIEQANRRVRLPLPDVTIASVPTLAQVGRRARFAKGAFDLVVVDEAHHGTATSYREVIGHFAGAALLGVTATPDRADGASLAPVFGATVFRYGIRRAVRDGYLVDVRRAVEVLQGLDLARLKQHKGDWTDAELEAELLKAPAVAAVADAILKHAGDRPTVLFCAGVMHSRAVAAALNARRTGCASAASGEDRAGVAALRAGRIQLLANTDLTTEGFDYPALACVALVRPTKSLGRATQQIGRGTRLHEGKRDLLVIEFVGGAAAGQVSTVDVVGCEFPQRVRALAERLLDRSPTMSVLDAIERAAAGAGSAAPIAERRTRAVVDPMRLVLSLDGMVMEAPRPGAPAATPEQVRLLAAEGLRVAGIDVRQAAILVAGIRWRRARGRSSPAQALELYRYGFELECTAAIAARRLAQMRAAGAAA